jgi:pimeloyl-ACP methyl ester carboxylesterase
MERVRHHGRETAYRQVGSGDPVLYVHGSGATHHLWVHQYARSDLPGAALDLSGHGRSDDVDAPAGEATLDAYADDVVAVARETGARVLAGTSLGGAVALHVALERAFDPEGLVLSGTGARLRVADDLLDALADDFEAAVEWLHGPDLLFHDVDGDTDERSRDAMRAVGRRVTERDFRTCDAFDARGRLEEVSTPALALVGDHDRLTPVGLHEELAGGLGNSRLEVVDDAAHLAMLERPEAWNGALDGFVAGL